MILPSAQTRLLTISWFINPGLFQMMKKTNVHQNRFKPVSTGMCHVIEAFLT